jgi:hypothetical protein
MTTQLIHHPLFLTPHRCETLSNGTTSGSTLDLTQPVIVDIDLTGLASQTG